MQKAWLSIDFEDIAHDFKREFGLAHDGSMRETALWRAYDAIETFCQRDLGGARLTFFTTGILAEKCPGLVARLARDGHEIACHYHWHDMARDDPPDVFEANLRRAIDALETASGQRVLGFRAPRFSLGIADVAHFGVLERLFAYDSSVTLRDTADLEAFRAAVGIERLVLLPVTKRKVWRGLPPLRTGGAHLKYAPASVTCRSLDLAARGGLAPMVYLHPYEFVADGSFRFPLSEMTGLAPRRKAFLWARQVHCHVLGNAGVPDRLRAIFRQFAPGGTMRELLPA